MFEDALNEAQRSAATHGGGPLLIVAGAGTGKTTTLASRVAWLLAQGVSPERLLLLTFSRRAAREMTSRAERIAVDNGCGADASRIWSGTFHAIGNRMLRRHGRALGIDPSFTVLDQADAADVMNLLRDELGYSGRERRFPRKETLAGIAIGPLVKDLMGRDALEGRGSVALDVAAAGSTVNAMKKSLDGTARVELKDGAIKGVNLTEALRKTRAAFGSKSAQQQGADQSQRTDFSAMSASFTLRNGVAHNDDLEVKAPLVRVGGAGDIDIGNSQLNYLARATVVATSKGQGGAELEHLRGLTIPVKLTGPFDAPKYEIDYRALAGDAAKAKVKEKAREKIEQKLRGLFKR